jgi:hypothetical protein
MSVYDVNLSDVFTTSDSISAIASGVHYAGLLDSFTTSVSLSANQVVHRYVVDTCSFSDTLAATAQKDLPTNVTFIGVGDDDLTASTYFVYASTLAASVDFKTIDTQDLMASVLFGTYRANLPATVSFINAQYTDFIAQINIQSVNIIQPGNYGGTADFQASIVILSPAVENLIGKVTFRQPPIELFLPATVLFYHTFILTAVNVETQIAYSGEADNTGYFHIDNLPAGTYTVTPTYPGVTFSPTHEQATVGPSNAFIYFTALGVYTISNLKLSTPVGVCQVNPSDGNPCTFTIEGFILPDVKKTVYQPIVAIITDPAIETAYKQTLRQIASN